MTTTTYVVLLGNLAAIGLLPLLFFRRGRLNLRWWLTATPLFGCGGLVVAAWAGVLQPAGASPHLLRQGASVAAAIGSVTLIAASVRSHRQRPALWHQDHDQPSELVQRGPYRHVRHPLYTAFLATLLGVALAVPHPLVAVVALHGTVMLHLTARREEHLLLSSTLGGEYADYMRRAGRFLPGMGRLA